MKAAAETMAALRRESEAAMKIQSAYRGKVGRAEAETVRRHGPPTESVDRTRAAVKLQSQYRGQSERRHVAELKRAREREEAEQARAAVKIQSAVRARGKARADPAPAGGKLKTREQADTGLRGRPGRL